MAETYKLIVFRMVRNQPEYYYKVDLQSSAATINRFLKIIVRNIYKGGTNKIYELNSNINNI